MSTALESHLRGVRSAGRKALVLFMTGGFPTPDLFCDYVTAAVDGGADVMEVGLPFSDPVIDGPTVQLANQVALGHGITPVAALDAAFAADIPVPVVPMTYANLVFRMGIERFAVALHERGFAGAIVPDLPLEESSEWEAAAFERGLAAVMLAAPSTPDDRLAEICRRSTGFVYAQSLMGVTGVRDALATSATEIGARVRACTDRPVIVGIGISTPEQAAAASKHADGVVVASAVLRRILDGATPSEITAFCRLLRRALDQ